MKIVLAVMFVLAMMFTATVPAQAQSNPRAVCGDLAVIGRIEIQQRAEVGDIITEGSLSIEITQVKENGEILAFEVLSPLEVVVIGKFGRELIEAENEVVVSKKFGLSNVTFCQPLAEAPETEVPVETATVVPTAIPTNTATVVPTVVSTATAVPTNTPVVVTETEVPTLAPTNTSTAVALTATTALIVIAPTATRIPLVADVEEEEPAVIVDALPNTGVGNDLAETSWFSISVILAVVAISLFFSIRPLYRK